MMNSERLRKKCFIGLGGIVLDSIRLLTPNLPFIHQLIETWNYLRWIRRVGPDWCLSQMNRKSSRNVMDIGSNHATELSRNQFLINNSCIHHHLSIYDTSSAWLECRVIHLMNILSFSLIIWLILCVFSLSGSDLNCCLFSTEKTISVNWTIKSTGSDRRQEEINNEKHSEISIKPNDRRLRSTRELFPSNFSFFNTKTIPWKTINGSKSITSRIIYRWCRSLFHYFLPFFDNSNCY